MGFPLIVWTCWVWSRIEDPVYMRAESYLLRTEQKYAYYWPFVKFIASVM